MSENQETHEIVSTSEGTHRTPREHNKCKHPNRAAQTKKTRGLLRKRPESISAKEWMKQNGFTKAYSGGSRRWVKG